MLEPVFLKYGVNVVCSGHDEICKGVKSPQEIYYSVSGTTGHLGKGHMRPTVVDSGVIHPQRT